MTDPTEAADRVRAFCDAWGDWYPKLMDDNVRNIRITDLRAILAAHDAQAAEIGRLRGLLADKKTRADTADRARRRARAAEREARDEAKRMRAAMCSIARNTCCDGCQEAARIARAALTPQDAPDA